MLHAVMDVLLLRKCEQRNQESGPLEFWLKRKSKPFFLDAFHTLKFLFLLDIVRIVLLLLLLVNPYY